MFGQKTLQDHVDAIGRLSMDIAIHTRNIETALQTVDDETEMRDKAKKELKAAKSGLLSHVAKHLSFGDDD